jgi:NagD protein
MPLAYLVDVQGTLLSDTDKSPLPGAKEWIDYLNTSKIPYCVITNNTKEPSEQFLAALHAKGLHIKHYLDPFMVLDKILENKEVYAFGPDAFKTVLDKKGYTHESSTPRNLLIASDTAFDAEAFAKMIELASNGVGIVGMHGTSIYAKNGRKFPGVGAILALLEYATSQSTTVIGKPSQAFYTSALSLLQTQNSALTFKDVCMISDDAKGDLVGAKALGMETTLVLSGKVKSAREVAPLRAQIDQTRPSIHAVWKGVA